MDDSISISLLILLYLAWWHGHFYLKITCFFLCWRPGILNLSIIQLTCIAQYRLSSAARSVKFEVSVVDVVRVKARNFHFFECLEVFREREVRQVASYEKHDECFKLCDGVPLAVHFSHFGRNLVLTPRKLVLKQKEVILCLIHLPKHSAVSLPCPQLSQLLLGTQ